MKIYLKLAKILVPLALVIFHKIYDIIQIKGNESRHHDESKLTKTINIKWQAIW